MAAPQYRSRPLHRSEEFVATATVGGGLILIVLVFLLDSAVVSSDLGTSLQPLLTALMLIGLMTFIGGIIFWLFYNRPWRQFDDWSTPMYTGHDHHDDHHAANATEPHHDAVVVADVALHEDAVRYGETVAAAEEKRLAGSIPLGAVNDLTLLEGIGPKIAGALTAAGITTFAQLAEQSPGRLEQIVRDAGVRMVGHAQTWPQQAQLAAQGRFDELNALKKQLTSGRNK